MPARPHDAVPAAESHDEITGKGRPTPKRKVAEAAHKRPLVPPDRRAAAKQSRSARREQRDREYQAMQSGDERYLPARDKGPVRRYVRQYVDARYTLGEFFLPFAVVMLILQFALAQLNAAASLAAILVLYLYVVATLVDGFVLWRRLRSRLTEKFGPNDARQRGLAMYAVMRGYQMRRLRMPKPQTARGQYPA